MTTDTRLSSNEVTEEGGEGLLRKRRRRRRRRSRTPPRTTAMGAAYGKKRAYSIEHEPPSKQQSGSRRNLCRASAYSDLKQHSEGVHRRAPAVCSSAVQAAHLPQDNDIIKPKKLANPVKASKSHQELHRELLSKSTGVSVEVKPELQRVLESRKREQLIRQRKQEDAARRKMSPLEAELLKRHRKLEELEKAQEEQQEAQQENLRAPEFIKVKENLRRTSFCKDEKTVE